MAEKGSCRPHEVKAGEIRKMSANQGSLWLRLPLAAAKKAAEGGTIQIGWFKVKIDLLEARPLRCFKCLERGHVKERCPNPQDRSDKCYRCGDLDHVAKECTAPPRCPVCTDLGRKADHVLGSQQCTTQIRRGITERIVSPPPPPNEEITSIQPSREERREQPKPQRPPRTRGQDAPSTPNHMEEAMETEPLEEGKNDVEQ